ncbi:hypothetical protein HDU97_007704 [Phlyctochytrium planicorne]|nr:hypothetical protein HDU97_007704 [Phlyctochytrium planicorne]
MVIAKKDWQPEKNAIYVFDGPGYVWLLCTAVLEKGRDLSGTATAGRATYSVDHSVPGTASGNRANDLSPQVTFTMEKAAAVEWAKELAHARGHMRFETFVQLDENESQQKTFWEAVGVLSPQQENAAASDGSTTNPEQKPEETHIQPISEPIGSTRLRTFTRASATGEGKDRNVSVEIPSTPHITKILFKATDVNVVRTLEYEEIAKGAKLKTSLLQSSAIHFLDTCDCFYVWIGASASLLREPLGLALEFLVKTCRPFNLPVVCIEEGGENDWFMANFESEEVKK